MHERRAGLFPKAGNQRNDENCRVVKAGRLGTPDSASERSTTELGKLVHSGSQIKLHNSLEKIGSTSGTGVAGLCNFEYLRPETSGFS